MFKTTMVGALAVQGMIKRKEKRIGDGVGVALVKTLVQAQTESKPRTPKDTGLLRSNTKIVANTSWMGKHVPLINKIHASSGRQRRAAIKLKNKASTASLSSYMKGIKGSIRGALYNDMPYANRRDKEGGLTQPRGFISALNNKYQRVFRLRVRAVVHSAGRA